MLLSTAQATKNYFGSRWNKNARLRNFTMLQKQQKSVYSSKQSIGNKSFTNMVAIINIDALKTQEQMRLKIDKKYE